MPLQSGSGQKVISDNIHELTHHGSRPRSHDQIVAIALSNADRHPRANGGLAAAATPRLAPGGFTPANSTWAAHQAERSLEHEQFHPKGLFGGDGAGRTDRLARAVPADSFVFPADTVSALGQGHTVAGAKILDGIFQSAPYGAPLAKRRAAGGTAPADGLSHVLVASGEYLAHPDDLARIGSRLRAAKKSRARSDLAAGHEWARGFVSKVRDEQKKFLKSAPEPKK